MPVSYRDLFRSGHQFNGRHARWEDLETKLLPPCAFFGYERLIFIAWLSFIGVPPIR